MIKEIPKTVSSMLMQGVEMFQTGVIATKVHVKQINPDEEIATFTKLHKKTRKIVQN